VSVVDLKPINKTHTHVLPLIHQLVAHFRLQTSDGIAFHEKIRLKAHLSHGHPSTDIAKISSVARSDGTELLEIILNFFGIYGVDSPLPSFFNDELFALEDDEQKGALCAFLDIFNHRLYWLYYQSWQKYRHALIFSTGPEQDVITQRLLSLIGLRRDGVADQSDDLFELLPFSSMLSQQTLTKEALQKILNHFFSVPIRVIEFVPRRVSIPKIQRNRLGKSNTRLGQTLLLGQSAMQVSNRIQILLGPMTWEEFLAFQKGASQRKRLDTLIQKILPATIDYELVLKLPSYSIKPLSLKGRRLTKHDGVWQLGRSSWIGRSSRSYTYLKQ